MVLLKVLLIFICIQDLKRQKRQRLGFLIISFFAITLFFDNTLPEIESLISKAKKMEAKTKLKNIHNSQIKHRRLYSKYSINMEELDFEPPKTTKENGTSNYTYEILSGTSSSFIARAIAINDFDGDGVFNVWEINESGNLKQIIKD